MNVSSPSVSSEDSRGNLRGFIDDTDNPPSPGTVRRDIRECFRNKRDIASREKHGDLKRLRGKVHPEKDLQAAMWEKVFIQVKALPSIVGREEEARAILAMMMQPEGGVRPLLVGPAGIGKMSIVNKAAALIKNDPKVAPILGNRKIFCVSCGELLADSVGDGYVQIVSDKLKEIFDEHIEGKSNPPILYFRDIEKLIHLDQVGELVQSLLKTEIPFLASISEEAKHEAVEKSIKILSKFNFQVVEVKESPISEVEQIVLGHLQVFPPEGKVQITKGAISLAVRLAAKYEYGRPFPVKAIQLVQECGNRVLLNGGSRVGSKNVIQIVSSKTGVPEADLTEDTVFNEKNFERRLNQVIIGQKYAIEAVSQRVASYKLGLLRRDKPWGVFLFAGPTGVGKTELAKQLARYLFNDEKNLIVINGSEYREEYTLSNLIGSAKGYEGNDTGGLLTGPLLKNPHQVVLLDEFEKAHRDVRMLFLQVFDQGMMTDRRGMKVDCTQALFIMTTNVGSDQLFIEEEVNIDEITDTLKPLLVETFSPELCNRFSAIVPFMPLEKSMLPDLAIVTLDQISQRLKKQNGIDLFYTPELVDYFASCEVDLRFGMRGFCKMVDEAVVSVIKDAMLRSERRLVGKMSLTYKNEQFQLRLSRT